MNLKTITKVTTNAQAKVNELMTGKSRGWDDLTEEEQNAAVTHVLMVANNPDATPENIHSSWMRRMHEWGYTPGPMVDNELKEHPLLVPFNELPYEVKVAYCMLYSLVNTLKNE